MSFTAGLRIVTVVMLGWVLAHSARVVLMSIAGHERIPPRDLLGEIITGIGMFIVGWALLPGGTRDQEATMMLVGIIVWVIGAMVQPIKRATPKS
jgi:drug/metabolite transporter (DMT)-like permease